MFLKYFVQSGMVEVKLWDLNHMQCLATGQNVKRTIVESNGGQKDVTIIGLRVRSSTTSGVNIEVEGMGRYLVIADI